MTESHPASLAVWLTRPAGTGHAMIRRLQQLGATVLHAPVLEIQPLAPSRETRQRLESLASYRHVIFISGNAVRHGLGLIVGSGARWADHTLCYAIGKATAQALAEQGIAAHQPDGPMMNSEALLDTPLLRCPDGERVLIVRGCGGREYLADSLRARGAHVDYLEAYRRVKSGTLPGEISRRLGTGCVDYILAGSGETVINAVELAGPTLQRALMDTAIVVPGRRVGAIARQAGFRRVIEAVNAGDDAMIDAILGATQQQG